MPLPGRLPLLALISFFDSHFTFNAKTFNVFHCEHKAALSTCFQNNMYQIELQYSNDSFMIIPYPLFRIITLFIRYECILKEFPCIFLKNYIDVFNTQYSTAHNQHQFIKIFGSIRYLSHKATNFTFISILLPHPVKWQTSFCGEK